MAFFRYRNKSGRFAKKGRGKKREQAASGGRNSQPTVKRFYKLKGRK